MEDKNEVLMEIHHLKKWFPIAGSRGKEKIGLPFLQVLEYLKSKKNIFVDCNSSFPWLCY